MEQDSSIIKALRTITPLIPSKEKKRFVLLCFLSTLMAFSELVLTGMVAILAAIFASPDSIAQHRYILWLQNELGFTFFSDARYLALGALCAILMAIAAKNVLAIIQQWHSATFSESVSKAIREHLFRFYLRAPYLWILHTGTSELLFGLGAAQAMAGSLLICLQVFSSLIMIIILVAGLIAVSPLSSLVFLTVLGLGGTLVVKQLRRSIDTHAHKAYTAEYGVHTVQQLGVHAIKEMRIYGREHALLAAFIKQLQALVRAKKVQLLLLRLPVASLETLGFATLVGVLLILILLQDASMAKISGILGFMAATAWRILPVANRLVDSMSSARSLLPYLMRVVAVIGQERKMAGQLMPEIDTPYQRLAFEHSITIDNATFTYNDSKQPALRDVSLTIKPGQMIGFVGFSGAGKSTLVNILTGLIPPTCGNLKVDGTEIGRHNARAWLANIGYVAQSPYILDATLAANIALSRWGEEIDMERVLECCKMAALDFLDELPDGLETVLGERGVRLSGGQAQRVAIARALYNNPKLLIFDEATSALDMKNERAIHSTIMSLHSQVTMVIVAHRLSTVENCDTLVWLDKGVVKMAGPVNDVLPYYKMAMTEKSTS